MNNMLAPNIYYGGRLYAENFLLHKVQETTAWQEFDDDAFNKFKYDLAEIFKKFNYHSDPDEATTEEDCIKKILHKLGWHYYLTQQYISNKEIPDMLLFADEQHKKDAQAVKEKTQACKHITLIVENKKWDLHLDRKSTAQKQNTVPSSQMLRYLSRVDLYSEQKSSWGILTNGRLWRLYYQKAQSRSEEYLEFDLKILCNLDNEDISDYEQKKRDHSLKLFYLYFCHQYFTTLSENGKPLHLYSLEETKNWEISVKEDLADKVFNDIFEAIIQQLIDNDDDAPAPPYNKAYLAEVKKNALIYLYRLLFVFYAEDRNLLPISNQGYFNNSLRKLRQDTASQKDRGIFYYEHSREIWEKIQNIFRAVNHGSRNFAIPPYNGGLFSDDEAPLLNKSFIEDKILSIIIDKLSRSIHEGKNSYINYRDLSVQQLGSVYEKLLEYDVVHDSGHAINVQLSPFARKASGSYYTPDDLVHLVLNEALSPLINEKKQIFDDKLKEYQDKKISFAELQRYDIANAILQMRIADIAMGSGHFLVSLVDYLADIILETLHQYDNDDNIDYISPIHQSLEHIRKNIMENALNDDGTQKWYIDESHCDDRQLIRRMILKQVIHGVDLNPMAVELAKVSLWLHTFTVGAPLSFLDHHLKCGNSLFGDMTHKVMGELQQLNPLFLHKIIDQANDAIKEMEHIHNLSDAVLDEAKQSKADYDKIIDKVTPLNHLLAFCHALRYLGLYKIDVKKLPLGLSELLDNKDMINIIINGLDKYDDGKEADLKRANQSAKTSKASKTNLARLLRQTKQVIDEHRFFSYECAFPHIWHDWADKDKRGGGFDAIIGNPPWEKLKLQEVEWFASRNIEIAKSTGAKRKQLIKALERSNPALSTAYHHAYHSSKSLLELARKAEDYPLLSAGDINFYSLFVERALSLINKNGMVGLVVPSGIASDKPAAQFFQDITDSNRLKSYYDFENKKQFFTDIHASFKFCTIAMGGQLRYFNHINLAQFIHRGELDNKTLNIDADIFKGLNPNTSTMPIIRNQRDLDIMQYIYDNIPILYHHGNHKHNQWQIKYNTLFHMTNDSHLFLTGSELSQYQAYKINNHYYKKSDEEFLTLYEGKMIHQFNHRYASVKINKDNLHNQASSAEVDHAILSNPNYLTLPQYWVNKKDIDQRLPNDLHWVIGFRDITNTTNMRTMIASILPRAAYGHKLPIILPNVPKYQQGDNRVLWQQQYDSMVNDYHQHAWLLMANFNSFILDYIARNKIQGTNATWYIVEQLPIIPLQQYHDMMVGDISAFNLLKSLVLRLIYNSHDMAIFAQDLGYDDAPFIWHDEQRLHDMCKLNALYFMLYGINDENDIEYIMDSFPIVKKQSLEKYQSNGKPCYAEKQLIINYHRALKVGNYDVKLSL